MRITLRDNHDHIFENFEHEDTHAKLAYLGNTLDGILMTEILDSNERYSIYEVQMPERVGVLIEQHNSQRTILYDEIQSRDLLNELIKKVVQDYTYNDLSGINNSIIEFNKLREVTSSIFPTQINDMESENIIKTEYTPYANCQIDSRLIPLELKLFAGAFSGPPPIETRIYTNVFTASTTCAVYFELNFQNNSENRIDTVYSYTIFNETGAEIYRTSLPLSILPTDTKAWSGYGYSDPGKWTIGKYKVKACIGKLLEMSSSFEIVEYEVSSSSYYSPYTPLYSSPYSAPYSSPYTTSYSANIQYLSINNQQDAQYIPPAFQPVQSSRYITKKSKIAVIIIAFFLGCLGIHHFYLGNNSKGVSVLIISFFTCGLYGAISGLACIVKVLTGSLKYDYYGNPLV